MNNKIVANNKIIEKFVDWIKKNIQQITIAIIILAITFFAFQFIRTGLDYWWHLKAGEYMISNKIILTKDVFSWFATQYNLSWISHEWLFEILIYGMKVLFGNYHIIIYCSLTLLLLQLILFLGNKKKYLKNIPFTIVWIIIGIIFLGNTLMPRPHMFSYIFVALSLYLLFDLLKNENSKKIYFLPLITLLWANVHGGSSNLSYILCFIFFLLGQFSFSLGKLEAKPMSKIQLKKYFLVMLLCVLAILCNPHGIDLLWYPYQNMQDSFILKTISEWRASNANLLSDLAIFAFFGMWLFIIFKSDKKLQLLDGILLATFAFLALKSVRFWPFAYIASSFIIFDYIKKLKIDKKYNLLFLLASIFICIIVVIMPKGNIVENLNEGVVDESFIEVIKEEQPQKLYNYYDYGGYLIYRDIPVFIDGRADLYSKHNYRDYYYLSKLEGDFIRILEHYKFDMFLIDKGTPLATYLSEKEEYEILLEKNNTVIYQLKK